MNIEGTYGKLVWAITAMGISLAMGSAARADAGLTAGERFETSNAAVVEVARLESCTEVNTPKGLVFEANAMSCAERDSLSGALEVTEMTFSGFGLAAMCSVEGAPLGVVFSGLGLSTQIARFVVSRMPCENPADDAKVKALARRTVCEVLARQGWNCDPDAPDSF